MTAGDDEPRSASDPLSAYQVVGAKNCWRTRAELSSMTPSLLSYASLDELKALGCDGYLVKPFKGEDLWAKIAEARARRGKQAVPLAG